MWLTRGALADYVRNATQPVLEHVQRLESDLLHLRGELEGERQLRQMKVPIHAAAHTALAIGAAVENFAQSMRAPLPPVPRGRAGGLARASSAWRFLDGTFMSESEIEELLRQEHERSAAGGRARAATARREPDGRFLPNSPP